MTLGNVSEQPDGSAANHDHCASPLAEAERFALTYQLLLGLFSALILDGGLIFGMWSLIFIFFWCSVFILELALFFQHRTPSAIALLYVRLGFLLYGLMLTVCLFF